MSEEKSSSIGTMIVVAIAAGLIGYVIGKPAPPQVQAEKPDPPEKPAEPEEPAFVNDGLVAYYPFNGNAMDGSGNGNHGEVNGATLAKDRHGAEDNAYDFDGTDDDIRVNKWLGVFKDQITMSVWVKADSKRQHEFTVLRKDTLHPNRKFDWGVGISETSAPGVSMQTEISGDNTFNLIAPPQASAIGDKWAHLIVVRDEANMYLYLNGLKIGQVPINGKIQDTAPGFTIGSIDSDHEFAKGQIDEIRIYNRALSEEEVKALYDLEKPKGK